MLNHTHLIPFPRENFLLESACYVMAELSALTTYGGIFCEENANKGGTTTERP